MTVSKIESSVPIHSKRKLLILKDECDGYRGDKCHVIVDFYNVYCNYINFKKNRQFSVSTFINCMEQILTATKGCNLLIISKQVFEVDVQIIKELTKIHKHITYVIVEDLFLPKSKNKERDDFTCILLQNVFSMKHIPNTILTNDKFSNIDKIIKNIKPFRCVILKDGSEIPFVFDQESLSCITKFNVSHRTEFYFKR